MRAFWLTFSFREKTELIPGISEDTRRIRQLVEVVLRRADEAQQESAATFKAAEEKIEEISSYTSNGNPAPATDAEKELSSPTRTTGSRKRDSISSESNIAVRDSVEQEEFTPPEMERMAVKERQSTAGSKIESCQPPDPLPRIQTPELVKALNTAAMHGFADTTSLLLATGVDVNAYDEEFTALWRAVEACRTKTVELLLEHEADPNLPRKKGSSPLQIAVSRGQLGIVRMLVAKGADVKEPGLLHRAMNGIDEEILACLVDAGADVCALQDGKPVLFAAISWEKVGVVELLLQKGATPTAQGRDSYSPVVHAAQRNRADIVQLLLMYGRRNT